MSFRLINILTLTLFFNSWGFSQNLIIKPENGIVALQDVEIQPHEKKGAYYNEFWNYHVALDNGAEIYLRFAITHFGRMKSAVTIAHLSLLNWNEKNYQAERVYDLDKLVFEKDSYKMNLNPERSIWFEGKLPETHKIRFRTNKNNIHFDINLDFTSISDGFKWGDGIFKIGENDEVGIFTQIPGANVAGFVALDYDTVKVSGVAYMDQIYQTNIGTRLFSQVFRFNKKQDDKKIGGFFMIPKDAPDEVVGYAFEFINGKTTLKKPVFLKTEQRREFLNETIPSRIEVCYSNSTCDIIEIDEMYERKAMLDELGGIKKMLTKRFLGGNIVEMRGKAFLNGDTSVFYNLSILD